jgi:hypothetical protein
MKCKHKHKIIMNNLVYEHYGTIANIPDKPTVKVCDYIFYMCLDCKCVVWEQKREGER